MRPLAFTCAVDRVRDALAAAIDRAGGRIVAMERDHVHAEFTSRMFGFVDDVEFVIDSDRSRIDFRSASRVGHWDLGANRRRMRKLVQLVGQAEKIEEVREQGR